MKSILIILLLAAVGCVAVEPVTQKFPDWTKTQNLKHAYTYEENLKGMTQDEILDKFGTPDEKVTTQDVLEGEQESWVYRSMFRLNRSVRVNFINGRVNSIIYN